MQFTPKVQNDGCGVLLRAAHQTGAEVYQIGLLGRGVQQVLSVLQVALCPHHLLGTDVGTCHDILAEIGAVSLQDRRNVRLSDDRYVNKGTEKGHHKFPGV